MSTIKEMRKYIRHPTDIPIECTIADGPVASSSQMKNVSRSGLSFTLGQRVDPGSTIHLKILLEGYDFEVDGIVMWCQDMENDSANRYEIGVKFSNNRAEFSVRMIEQLCHVEQYRQQVLAREGRQLTSEQATIEWIKNFADEFPE